MSSSWGPRTLRNTKRYESQAALTSHPFLAPTLCQLHNDYLAARACGMHALLLDPTGSAAHDELPPDAVVSSLADVPAKVDLLLQT